MKLEFEKDRTPGSGTNGIRVQSEVAGMTLPEQEWYSSWIVIYCLDVQCV